MKRLIKKILKEDRRQMYLDKIVQIMKKDYPLIKNMNLYGFTEQLSEDELIYVFSGIFGEPVNIRGNSIYNQNGKQIYSEDSNGDWVKYEYDENGKRIYFEDSDGYWEKLEFDENGNQIYYEDSNGYWSKREYDNNGNRLYYENSDGYWRKYEYDENGKLTYREDSTGYIEDYR